MNGKPSREDRFQVQTLVSTTTHDRDSQLEFMVGDGWSLESTELIHAPNAEYGLMFVDTLFWYPADDEQPATVRLETHEVN